MSEKLLPYKILFLEDEEETRQNYVIYLKTLFSEVFEAADGEEGYKKYQENKPHIIIIDINLPKMSGLEFLKKIRQNDHNTKAIMLTAHTNEEFLLEAASLKLVKYLKKPIARKELHEILLLSIKELQEYEIKFINHVELYTGLIWEFDSKKLRYFEDEVDLTPKERALIELLCKNINHTVEYDLISEYVWGYDYDGSLDSIKTLVKKLRRKIPKDTIENVFATGYKITTK